MPIKVSDPAKDKKPKRYEETLDVPELDPSGAPTGNMLKVRRIAADPAIYQDREQWKEKRLQELEAAGVSEVTVVRGSDDDVIGLQW